MKRLNINDNIKIKLTESGIAILKRRHKEVLKFYAKNSKILKEIGEFKIPEVDENGYTEMTLLEVIHLENICITEIQSLQSKWKLLKVKNIY